MTVPFAVLAQPVAPGKVTTTAEGLVAGMTEVPTHDGVLPVYLARPDHEGPHPVVLVVQEIFGLHEHIRDVTRRLAHLGYLAMAPALYHRLGDPALCTSYEAIRDGFVRPTPDTQVMQDLDACADWAHAHGGHADQLAITGFCWGGRITWLYAAWQPRLKAAVAWYGRLQGPVTPGLQDHHPLEVANHLRAPVLGLYGGQDQGIPLSDAQAMASRLTGSSSEMHIYPDAPHAFFADYRDSHRPEAAADGWLRLKAWLTQHGVGGSQSTNGTPSTKTLSSPG